MREHLILFSAPMVLALLADRKSVTRRLSPSWMKVKAGDRLWVRETLNIIDWDDSEARLGACVQYAADEQVRGWTHDENAEVSRDWGRGKKVFHSIFMPRWASRITLEALEDPRMERLQDITPEDAEAEGLAKLSKDNGRMWKYGIPDRDGLPGSDDFGWDWHLWRQSPVDAFEHLWRSLHTKPGERWEDNPEVVRVGKFRRIPA